MFGDSAKALLLHQLESGLCLHLLLQGPLLWLRLPCLELLGEPESGCWNWAGATVDIGRPTYAQDIPVESSTGVRDK